MITSDEQLDKYGLISRLFKLVNDMPEDQQLALLKQLLKNNTTKYLFKLIIDMSDYQQHLLLEEIEKVPLEEMPVKTVSLDEEEASMRGHFRKPCLISVNYSIQDNSFKGRILDISPVGVFIETSESFPAEQEMKLTFSLPNYSKPLNLNGIIAWIGQNGIGVKFKNLTQRNAGLIKSFIEK